MEIILASGSPRRRELFSDVVPSFRVVPSAVREEEIVEDDPVAFAVEAAVRKAKDVGRCHPAAVVVGADTVVALGRQMLGKPKDSDDARRMLRLLSGTTHRVITGLAVYRADDGLLLTDFEISRVSFRPLTDDLIDEYLAGQDFLDKAGSYAVQDVGDRFISAIRGGKDNVVGLPVKRARRLLERFLQPLHTIELVDVALPRDWAVGRHQGEAVFVPGGVVGEKVAVRIVKKKRNFSYAEIVRVEQPSPDRVDPVCPAFGQCGGCVFQNLRYERQLELKERYLRQTLRKFGGIEPSEVEWLPFSPSPAVFSYRNKMEFAFGSAQGAIALGLRPRVSPVTKSRGGIVALGGCPIAGPMAEAVFPAALQFVRESGRGPFDVRSGRGFFRHLILREGKNTGDLMAVLVTAEGEPGNLTRCADLLVQAAPGLRSLWWVVNTRPSDAVVFEKKNHLLGDPFIEEKLGGLVFRIHPQTFFQPNTAAAEVLYAAVALLAQLSGSERVLGCYCGSGPIELFLAGKAAEVVGIDVSQVNIADARENARRNGITNCVFYDATVEEGLRKISGPFDLAVVDPPRAGLSPKAIAHLAGVKAERIVYVSCNPATLGRDAGILRENGYRPVKVAGFDLFPHTAHVETVMLLERKQ